MRPRTLLRIARWEATKGIGGLDRGVVAVAVAALAFCLAVGAVVAVGGPALEDGIYRVGVSQDSPFHEPVAEDPTFAAVDPDPAATRGDRLVADDRYDLYLEEGPRGTTVYVATANGEPTEKSRAALAALRESVDRYNDRRMHREENRTAAFPVTVTLRYVGRAGTERAGPGDGGGGEGAGGDGGGSDAGDEADWTTEGGGDGDDEGGDRVAAPSLGAFDLFGTSGASGSPSDLSPPFPFQSLVLAFAFVLPLNFLVQAYGSSMLAERLDRRGELLLVAPVGRAEIVLGKTLPYLGVAVAATALVVVGLRALGGAAGYLSLLAVTPLSLLFLGTTFLGAMFARSFKELTFVTVTLSTVLTTFAFVPAIFAGTSPVAFVSPLSIVVEDLSGEGVTAGQFAIATGPATLSAGVCFLFGLGLYREEDLFTQRPVHLKAIDALAGRVSRPRSVALVVALLVPFVFVAELLAVALLFALPIGVSGPLLFATVAVVEELAKGLPTYAGYLHGRYERSVPVVLAVGAAAGGGFFLAEKLTLAVQFVGLPESTVAEATFQTGLGSGDPAVVALLALAPLALHVCTATLSALGASRGRSPFLAGLLAAVFVHLAYNVAVVSRLV